MKPLPSIKDLRAAFNYEPQTGWLTWNNVHLKSHMKPGDRTGYVNNSGYRHVCFQASMFMEHRIIWAIVHGAWPPHQIDHINGVRDDNRLCNLREATPSQNQANKGAYKNNSSGFKGVSLCSMTGKKWIVRIQKDGLERNLGRFDTLAEAQAAYSRAAIESNGEFAKW